MHYPDRASAVLRFGHSDVVLPISSNRHRMVPPVNQQKYLINGICGTFDSKSNYFIPKNTKKF